MKLILLLIPLFLLLGCVAPEKCYEFKGLLFGSYVKIKVIEPDTVLAHQAVAKAFAELCRLDSLFSLYQPKSEIVRINRLGKGKLSQDFKNLLSKAYEVSEKSNGAFDITVYPLIRFWQECYKAQKLPDSTKLKAILKLVDYKQIRIKNDSIYLPANFALDLGGIAVGYSIDQAEKILKQAGIKTGLIDCGGDIIGFGNRKWRIGVKNPRGEGLVRTFFIQNQAIATSGDYEKFFIVNGKRYHHILNPKTGYPAFGLCSVTVIAPDAVTADAYSTTIFVLGIKDGLALVEKEPGVEAFMLAEANGRLKPYHSANLK